ncbi:centrosomal protein of 44 kDa-like [Elysia marginata]|uniref:Centrosomal protein of 44 kDa n=1 Tax=Elysia marginata TaxID=1093978 RepID=A0AAV4ITA4_9GAST|nr:centrosomal protein of 44 kDa-like [Elysia marginata]
MSSTGDLQNNFNQLANELKKVKYGKKLDADQIVSGSPKAYLPIYNFLFTSYNSKFNEDIVNSNNELYGKSDMRFMEAVYKIMRDMFDYKAKITRDQFFAPGFSEQKVIMAKEVLHLVRGRYNPPKSKRFHVTAARSGSGLGNKVPQGPTGM